MRPLLVLDGSRVDWRRTSLRMAMYFFGVVVLALGIVIQTESGLGVASLTCFADALSRISGVTLGTMVSATYIAYVFVQLVLLGREFQPRILLEIGFSVMIGMFTDVFSAVIPIHLAALPERVATMLLSLCLTSFGVSLVVNMGVVPNAPDGLVQVIAEKMRKRFGDVKVVFDSIHVAVALALTLAVLGTVGGFGPTTVISALFLGRMINVMNRLFAARLTRAAFGDVPPLASGVAKAEGE